MRAHLALEKPHRNPLRHPDGSAPDRRAGGTAGHGARPDHRERPLPFVTARPGIARDPRGAEALPGTPAAAGAAEAIQAAEQGEIQPAAMMARVVQVRGKGTARDSALGRGYPPAAPTAVTTNLIPFMTSPESTPHN